jgi:hypothetical protein
LPSCIYLLSGITHIPFRAFWRRNGIDNLVSLLFSDLFIPFH